MQAEKRVLVVVDPAQGVAQAAVRRGAWVARAIDARLDVIICHEPADSRERKAQIYDAQADFPVAEESRYAEQLDAIAQSLRSQSLRVTTRVIEHTRFAAGVIAYVLESEAMLVVMEAQIHEGLSRALKRGPDWDLMTHCPVPVWLAQPREWPHVPVILASLELADKHGSEAGLDAEILNLARFFAEQLAVPLHVFHAYVPMSVADTTATVPLPGSTGQLDDIQREVQMEQLQELLADTEFPPDHIHLAMGTAKNALVDCVAGCGAGLVVMGTVPRNWFANVVTRGTAQRVLDHVRSDLLVVKSPLIESTRAGEQEDRGASDELASASSEDAAYPPVWIP